MTDKKTKRPAGRQSVSVKAKKSAVAKPLAEIVEQPAKDVKHRTPRIKAAPAKAPIEVTNADLHRLIVGVGLHMQSIGAQNIELQRQNAALIERVAALESKPIELPETATVAQLLELQDAAYDLMSMLNSRAADLGERIADAAAAEKSIAAATHAAAQSMSRSLHDVQKHIGASVDQAKAAISNQLRDVAETMRRRSDGIDQAITRVSEFATAQVGSTERVLDALTVAESLHASASEAARGVANAAGRIRVDADRVDQAAAQMIEVSVACGLGGGENNVTD